MRRFWLQLIIFQAWCCSSGAEIRNSSCGLCGARYLAGLGDSIPTIAARCNTSVSEIIRSNDPNLPRNISGTEIAIPCSSGGIGCGVCGESYTVRYADTLSAIADACGMDLPLLERANPDIDIENIFVNQLIRVPCENAPPLAIAGCGACGFLFTVPESDPPPSKILQDCAAPAEEILRLNPGVNLSTLIPGQQLRMPCGSLTGSCGPCGVSYTVPAAEKSNRESVAAKCRVGFIGLTELNPGVESWKVLNPGTILKIPCSNRVEDYDDQHQLKNSGCICNTTFTVEMNHSSVSDVARECNVSSATISYANNLPVNGELTTGQRLKLPCGERAPGSRRCSICGSTVRPSVSVDLTTVAKACGVTVGGIQRATNTSLVTVGVGDVVRVPCEDEVARCGPCGIAYKALDGDDVSLIAVRCSTMIPEIEQANPGVNFQEGVIGGEVITIPCFSAAGCTASSSSLTAIVVMLLALVQCS